MPSSSPRPFPPPHPSPPQHSFLLWINPAPTSAPSSPSLGTLVSLMPLHLLLHTSNLEKNQYFDISQVSDLASGSTGHILGEFGSYTQKLVVGKPDQTKLRKTMSLISGGVMLTLPESLWAREQKLRWVLTILRWSCKDGRDLGADLPREVVESPSLEISKSWIQSWTQS